MGKLLTTSDGKLILVGGKPMEAEVGSGEATIPLTVSIAGTKNLDDDTSLDIFIDSTLIASVNKQTPEGIIQVVAGRIYGVATYPSVHSATASNALWDASGMETSYTEAINNNTKLELYTYLLEIEGDATSASLKVHEFL